ncbi:MAG: glycerate kinase [Akkermansiaceae bacterium]|nr:glycerate kinase [Akkermansiaceae bacterium]
MLFPVHIVISPDKFKGSLSAREAAEAIHRGFSSIFPTATYDLLPMADGGEGILDAFLSSVENSPSPIETTVLDALGRPVSAKWLMLTDGTAIIESSQANGLWRIAEDERDLLRASTFGVGQLIHEAVEAKAKQIIIGLGGSATNDAGLGMAAALGCRFLDENGDVVDPIPENIPAIHRIDFSEIPSLPPITAACDVANPLLGARGATRVYAQQKGLRPADAGFFENAHSHLVKLTKEVSGKDFSEVPGAGAAGGLGFGLMAFCGATLESGFSCIAGLLGAEARLSQAELIITGEGSLDSQTLEGKTPFGVSQLARKHSIPVYALAGCVADEEILLPYFDGITAITNENISVQQAMANAQSLLEQAARSLAESLRKA